MLSVFKVLETSRTLQLSIRWFSKIYNFKTKFPELYEHVDPSSVHLFEQPWIGSKQVVKWRCDKGPDHVWDATIDSRIQSYNRNHKCSDDTLLLSSYVCLLYWETSIHNKLTGNALSRNSERMVL